MSTGLERTPGLELAHLLESPHAVTFTPEGHAAIRAMHKDAYARIEAHKERAGALYLEESAGVARGERDTRYEAYKLGCAAFEAATFENLAAVLVSLLTLGGRVQLEDARNLYVSAPHLTYGVNQSRDGSWSVNS
jgi:hypothetical protein